MISLEAFHNAIMVSSALAQSPIYFSTTINAQTWRFAQTRNRLNHITLQGYDLWTFNRHRITTLNATTIFL